MKHQKIYFKIAITIIILAFLLTGFLMKMSTERIENFRSVLNGTTYTADFTIEMVLMDYWTLEEGIEFLNILEKEVDEMEKLLKKEHSSWLQIGKPKWKEEISQRDVNWSRWEIQNARLIILNKK